MTLIALLLQVVGTAFLFSAAIGVMRFADPLQRMHASTKAGTVGAGFVLLGTVVKLHEPDVIVIGLATLAFLLLTVPIAGHLLGRATYVSGAKLHGMRGDDELQGKLERSPEDLDARLNRPQRKDDTNR